MIILQTVAKHYQRLDVPTKSRASSRNKDSQSQLRPKTSDSQTNKTDAGKESKEELKEENSAKQLPADEQHQILCAAKIQRFMYDYILEKLKVEKLTI